MSDNTMLKQNIFLTGVRNARELGGYPAEGTKTVKKGIFLRSAALANGTYEDILRLKDVYHLSKVIDFRSKEEISGSSEMSTFTSAKEPVPDPEIEGAKYIHLPILNFQKMIDEMTKKVGRDNIPTDNLEAFMIMDELNLLGDNMYLDFVYGDFGKEGYQKFFKEIISLEDGRAVLFHCTQGKDRTGVAAMLLLSALGVPEEIILNDYLLTNEYNSELIAKERKMLEMSGRFSEDKIEDFLVIMDKVKSSTMSYLMGHIKEEYGSVKEYIIKELKVSAKDIDVLQERFLV